MTETILHNFGEAASISGPYAYFELDFQMNRDSSGNEITSFLDTETVYLLVSVEPGARILSINSSYGGILNAGSPNLVTRTKTIEGVSFKNNESEYEVPNFPISHSMSWYGNSGVLTRSGRVFRCNAGPRIGNLSYTFRAYQFRFRVPLLGLAEEEQFLASIAVVIEKDD